MMRHGACSSLSLLFSSSFSLNFSYLQEIIMGRKKLDFIMKLGSIPATKEGLAEKCSLIENRFKKLAAPQAPSADDDIVASLERLSSFSGLGTAIGEEIATLIKAKEHGEDNADDVIAPLDDLGASKDAKATIQFVNAAASYNAKIPVDLQELHYKVRTVEYDPTFFNNAVLTIPHSTCRATIFANGKFFVSGASTAALAKTAVRHVLELLQLCGYTPTVDLANFRVTNLTAVVDLHRNVNLHGLAKAHSTSVFMDNETFPAAFVMPEKSTEEGQKGRIGLSILVFATGKLVVTGGRSEKHLWAGFTQTFTRVLRPFVYEPDPVRGGCRPAVIDVTN